MRTLTAAEITALLACPVMRVRQAEAIFKINRNRLYEMMREGTLCPSSEFLGQAVA